MENESRENFILVGAFSPKEIQRVTRHLEELAIDYEVEFDDSQIRDMTPAAIYGGIGAGVTVNLYVDPERQLEVEAVIETLYPS